MTTSPGTESKRASERGAILVFTAIVLVVLLGFLAFVVDYGLLWVSRAQAQNAADAGALAGAIARAFDDPTSPPPSGGVVEDAARKSALQNKVWNASGGQQVANVSYTCPTGVAGSCVRVDVYRNAQFGSAGLPVFFGSALGITTHGVRATATARVANGNATNCMRPFSVIDRWWEQRNPVGEFNRWNASGNEFTPGANDWYEPPAGNSTGSGYSVPADVGAQVVLKTGNNPQSAIGSIVPGWSLPVRLPDGNGGYVSGANDFSNAIKQCIGNPVAIGDYLPTENGVMNGPTRQGVETDGANSQGGKSLINQDPNATWVNGGVSGSCAAASTPCASFSPRIVPIAVFDYDEFAWRHTANNWNTEWIPGTAGTPGRPGTGTFTCPAGGRCVRVSNIIGFFVENMVGSDIYGRVLMYPGEFIVGPPNLGNGSSFLQVLQLVR